MNAYIVTINVSPYPFRVKTWASSADQAIRQALDYEKYVPPSVVVTAEQA